MKIIATASLALGICFSAHSEKLTTRGLIFYDTNARDGAAYVTDSYFRGMEPHGDSFGIVMFGGALPTDSESYTAPPRGPLVLSFVHPQTGKAATVTKVDFWISNPLGFSDSPTPVPITFFDPQGRILSTQQIAAVEFPVSLRGVGPIGSIQMGEFEYPRYLMVSDIRFSPPRIIHAPIIQLPDEKQFEKANNFIDFETYPDGTVPGNTGVPASDEWQQLGVRLSDENGDAAAIFQSSGEELPTRSATHGIASVTGTLVFTFVDPRTGQLGLVRETGVWVSNSGGIGAGPTTVQFLDAAGEVVQTVTSSGKYFFAGARVKRGIAKIVLTDPDYFLADDLQFSRVRRGK